MGLVPIESDLAKVSLRHLPESEPKKNMDIFLF